MGSKENVHTRSVLYVGGWHSDTKVKYLVTPDVVKKFVTKDGDVGMHAIGKALVVVMDGTGFQKEDEKEGIISARYYKKHGKLERWQVEKWLFVSYSYEGVQYPRICRYWFTLNTNAEKKAAIKHLEHMSTRVEQAVSKMKFLA